MGIKLRAFVLALGYLMIASSSAFAENTGSSPDPQNIVGRFSQTGLNGWQAKEFKGKTSYHLLQLEGQRVLKADSQSAASGLYSEQKIDLTKTPFLNWRWRVEQPLTKLNEQAKEGDDFAVRVYVVKSGGLVFWDTKAINYVWAGNTSKGKTWPNPFAGDHAMMVAVRSAEDKAGTWFSEKRNIREDFKQLTGEDIRFIDAVAIMTDTDNSQGKAAAYYGDIYFSAD